MRSVIASRREPAGSAAFVALLCFAAALAPRLVLAVGWPKRIGDTVAYLRSAENVFFNHCISMSDPATAACVPHQGANHWFGYPLFVAATWFIGGVNDYAPAAAQAVLSAVAISYFAAAMQRLTGSRAMALASGLILAFSPLQIAWPRIVATEALSVAITVWVFAEMLFSTAEGRLRLWRLAAALVVALFVRMDLGLLWIVVAIWAFLAFPLADAIRRGAVLALIVSLPCGAWALRNLAHGLDVVPYAVTHKGVPMGAGFVSWLATVVHDEKQLEELGHAAMGANYSRMRLHDRDLLLPGERERFQALTAQLTDGGPWPAAVDEEFRRMAEERRAAAPAYVAIELRLRRAWHLWFGQPLYSFGLPFEYDGDMRADLARLKGEGGWTAVAARLAQDWDVTLAKAVVAAWKFAALALFAVTVFFLSWRAEPGRRAFLWAAFFYVLLRTTLLIYSYSVGQYYQALTMAGVEMTLGLGLGLVFRRGAARGV